MGLALIPASSGIKVLTRTGSWVLGINVGARLPFPLHLKKVSGGGDVRGTSEDFSPCAFGAGIKVLGGDWSGY